MSAVLSFLSRLAPYRKFLVAAAGFILAGVAQSGVLPVDSSWSRLIAGVLALGSLYGVWRFPNVPLSPASSGPRIVVDGQRVSPFLNPIRTPTPMGNTTANPTTATFGASTTTSVPPDPARVHDLTRETQTGGSTTASGAATVKLDPPQPPTGGTPGDGKDAA